MMQETQSWSKNRTGTNTDRSRICNHMELANECVFVLQNRQRVAGPSSNSYKTGHIHGFSSTRTNWNTLQFVTNIVVHVSLKRLREQLVLSRLGVCFRLCCIDWCWFRGDWDAFDQLMRIRFRSSRFSIVSGSERCRCVVHGCKRAALVVPLLQNEFFDYEQKIEFFTKIVNVNS